MTEYDEELMTAAKLHEQVRGDLDGDDRLLSHTGLISDSKHRESLSFVETTFPEFGTTDLGNEVMATLSTAEATEALHSGADRRLSHIVGLTEQDVDGSTVRLVQNLQNSLENAGAPAFVTGAGNPNTGKTNTIALLAELRCVELSDLLVVSNVRTLSLTDVVVTSAHDLATTLIEHRDRPKFVIVDEASTHFDARTYRREVATQWTPLAKRFAKIGVDACGLITHTGKDLHPEAKRLSTLSFFKTEKDVVEFFGRWPADADHPVDPLFGGPVENLESTGAEYDTDDAAPWSWNLEPELFTLDLGWSSLLDELHDRGPAD